MQKRKTCESPVAKTKIAPIFDQINFSTRVLDIFCAIYTALFSIFLKYCTLDSK